MSPETHIHQSKVEEKRQRQLPFHSLYDKAEHKLNNNQDFKTKTPALAAKHSNTSAFEDWWHEAYVTD